MKIEEPFTYIGYMAKNICLREIVFIGLFFWGLMVKESGTAKLKDGFINTFYSFIFFYQTLLNLETSLIESIY